MNEAKPFLYFEEGGLGSVSESEVEQGIGRHRWTDDRGF